MGKTTYYAKLKRSDKFPEEERLELLFDLINSFRTVQKPIETANFLQDLLTAKEIENLSIRLRIAKLLLKGSTYEEIVKKLHCSFATVAKVSLWLTEGGEGFKKVLSKLPVRYDLPKNLPPIPLEFQLPRVLSTLFRYSKAKNQKDQLNEFLKGVKVKEKLDKTIRASLKIKFAKKRSK